MKRAFADFGQSLAQAGPDTVGLFYYAGHGVQVDGVNYLIPSGAEMQNQADVQIETVDANWVLKQMEFAGNRMNIIILDACRNNPLPTGTRSMANGLARMDAPTGSFIAYSTAPGAVALDGTGGNSPYSQALATAIETQQLPLELLFRQVRVAVMNQTDNKQVPWDSSSLTGEFYFKDTGDTSVAGAVPAPTSAPRRQRQSNRRNHPSPVARAWLCRPRPACPSPIVPTVRRWWWCRRAGSPSARRSPTRTIARTKARSSTSPFPSPSR